MRSLAVKRALDLAGAGIGLLVGAPILATISAVVWATMGRPVFFEQRRTGMRGREFVLYKFRTMVDARDRDGRLLPDGERLTRVGRFLRATSLDELPALFNVLRAEMSLVGPRPQLVRYLPRYTPEQNRRHEVKPGITGWAQVNGRNALQWEERFALDVWYVDHWSNELDLRILVATLLVVIRRDGVTHPGSDTMPEFRGSPSSAAEP